MRGSIGERIPAMSVPALRRASPESLGISSKAILDFVDAASRELDGVHSFMLLRHGTVAAEGWWRPWTADQPHMLFSLSKSFTSTAAGLATSEGYFSVDDPVVKFFPESCPARPSANLAAMRVRDLLRMGTGHAVDTLGAVFSREDGDWVRAFLEQPVEHEPGTHFVYNSGATYMVSALVQRTTGKRVLDFLRPRLFEPLGIEGPTWEQCPRGIDTGGWGLAIRTEDIARFAQLMLRQGEWNGRTLVPRRWVEEATGIQIRNGDPAQASDWSQGYGYQFWRCRNDGFRGDGAFGQFAVVLPGRGAAIAMTAGLGDMQAQLNLVWKYLLPSMGDRPLPEDRGSLRALRDRLASLAAPVPGGTRPEPEGRVDGLGATYHVDAQPSGPAPGALAPQPLRVDRFRLVRVRGGAELHLREGGVDHRIAIGHGAWRASTTSWRQPARHRRVSAIGGWTPAGTFSARVCFTETPFRADIAVAPNGPTATFDYRQDLVFGEPIRAHVTGRRAG